MTHDQLIAGGISVTVLCVIAVFVWDMWIDNPLKGKYYERSDSNDTE